MLERVFGEEANEGPFAAYVVLRKLYSIVAFALIGFIVDRALPPIHRRAARAALIVALFSASIEVAQKLRDAPEGVISNAIDIACGALGGWLAVALPPLLRRRRR
ncbi:MAG TPA: hypothetical protein VGC96_01015 [Candidatus Elarobacter sp.]